MASNFNPNLPDITLYIQAGFEGVVRAARTFNGRELVKAERTKLFDAYVMACNKQQLVCLPNQNAMPIKLCGGAVWDKVDGCFVRFSKLVEDTLGRTLTRKEGTFIKSQWPAITAERRARVTSGHGYTEMFEEGSGSAKSEFYQRHTTSKRHADRVDHSRTFDYNRQRAELKEKLKKKKISHAEYNRKLAALKDMRVKVNEVMECQSVTRNMHNNSGTFHVSVNAKGREADRTGIKQRFSIDGYK